MYLGKVCEIARVENLYKNPGHPYSEALLNSIPIGDPDSKLKRKQLPGDVPDPSSPPKGCNFNTRCPYVKDICKKEEPTLKNINSDHKVACHFPDELELESYRF